MSGILLSIELRNANIFSFCSQSLLRSLVKKIIRAFVFLKLGIGMVLALAFYISLIIWLARVCLS